ncbi:hypothetical protein FS749_013618 [Ceratobasidium sp. UAMH 11750]|nr:hypothetical protein FS749_013618 [Ceratobasidium sp. UAMH 11750]
MEVLEIRLSLTPTVAVSRAQHASSLQNISQPVAPINSANPSPPSTPSSQSQTNRTSTRLRIKSTVRAQDKAAVAAAAPQAPKKRSRKKASHAPSTPGPVAITPSAQDTPTAGPSSVSPVPSCAHSRVSSVSSLALSQTQAQSRPPTSFGSTSTSTSNQSSQPSRPSSQTPQPQSPNRSLARLLLAASASSPNTNSLPNVGTPLFDSLVERLKTTGLLAQLAADPSGGTTDAQRQALLSILGGISDSSPELEGREGDGGVTDGAKTLVPSPALTAIRSPTPNPTPSPAPSPAAIPAPSPATLAAPSPSTSTFATPLPPPDPNPNRATRKREPEDKPDAIEPKRARLGLSEARTSSLGNLDSHLAKGLKLEDGGYASASGLGVSPDPISPSPSVASPCFSATTPNYTAPSPNLSALSAPSPNLSVPSPNISAASPYSYRSSTPAPPPVPLDALGAHSGTWPSSQPAPPTSGPSQPTPTSRSISQPNLFSSKPASASRKRAPRETPLRAQTDLPLISGPFITPRDQIGLPRVLPLPTPARCVAGPGRAKGSGAKKAKKQEGEKEALAEGGDLGHDKGNAEPERGATVRGVGGEKRTRAGASEVVWRQECDRGRRRQRVRGRKCWLDSDWPDRPHQQLLQNGWILQLQSSV